MSETDDKEMSSHLSNLYSSSFRFWAASVDLSTIVSVPTFTVTGNTLIILQLPVNPLTPTTSLVTLLTVRHIVLVMLVGEFGIGSTNNPLINIFILITYLLNILMILWREILSWSLMGVIGFKDIYHPSSSNLAIISQFFRLTSRAYFALAIIIIIS